MLNATFPVIFKHCGWCKKKKDGKNLCFSGKVMKNYEVALVWYFYAQSPKNSENVFLLRRRVANEGKWECSLEGPTLRLDVPNSPALCVCLQATVRLQDIPLMRKGRTLIWAKQKSSWWRLMTCCATQIRQKCNPRTYYSSLGLMLTNMKSRPRISLFFCMPKRKQRRMNECLKGKVESKWSFIAEFLCS